MIEYQKMFKYDGKTTKLIGPTRAKVYQEMYTHLSEKQNSNEQNHFIKDNWDCFYKY